MKNSISKNKQKKKVKDMTTLATRAGNDIKEMATLLTNFPSPDQWTQEQKEQTVKFAALLQTAQQVIVKSGLVGIDYEIEKIKFLDNASKTNSKHTRTSYNTSLKRLDEWTAKQGISTLELTPAQADDFIYALRAEGLSPSVIRSAISACSAFFTFLHRRHTAIDNPFRGTKARPERKAVKKIAIPNTQEVKVIINALPKMESAAVSVMAFRGLRAGALVEMVISGNTFTSTSKSKNISGTLPINTIKAIKKAGLDNKKPFVGILANTLEHRIAYAIKKLHKAGKVSAIYSCHDFRHFFAVTEYSKDKDIYRLKRLLDHASIQVTENYLKSINVDV